ncbi:MAG TPA: histidine kinase dimerization/phospho-acceptor domain-containing protein [Candidatus Xenobia bacterium]|nr:histidine kinase dimerization/phospho-acceptor domain-containing protein [Candidatus Xenobia bacterium]
MRLQPNSVPAAAPTRVLLQGLWRSEREALQRGLRADSTLQWLESGAAADALPWLEPGGAELLLCDLSFYLFLRDSGQAPGYDPAGLPTLVLVTPGEELQAAARLEHDPTEFMLRAGDYCALLPAAVRRLARRRRRRWEEVAALLRHEINNPLTGVLGNAELVLAEASALPEKTRRRLATIIQLAVRLRDVVRNLETQLDRDGSGLGRSPDSPASLRRPRTVAR